MLKTTSLGVVTSCSVVRFSHLPDTLVYRKAWAVSPMIPLKSDTGCNSMLIGASTGVLFRLTVAVVVKSDHRLAYTTFSGTVYIFIFCEFSVISLIFTH